MNLFITGLTFVLWFVICNIKDRQIKRLNREVSLLKVELKCKKVLELVNEFKCDCNDAIEESRAEINKAI